MRNASAACLLIAWLAGPLPAVAAQVAPGAVAQTPPVQPGQVVWVTTFDGRELSGTVVRVSASALDVMAPSGALSMPLSGVRTIETRDSLTNGARWGAIVGGVSLGIFTGLLAQGLKCESDCGADYSATRDTIEGVAWGTAVGSGAGALAGLLVDYLAKGRQVVYTGASTRSASWEIRPSIARAGLTMRATVRW